MAKRTDLKSEGAGAPALPRLPPGRHGLSREFVTKNQRDRLTAGMIASVAERGYHETTISHISAAAGVSRRTFYSYFSSKEEAYLDTFDLIADHLREAGREAASEETPWGEKVAARIATALGAFSANPDLARFVLIAPPRAGESPLSRYQRGLEEAARCLTEGIPDDIERPSEAVQQSMIGGMLSMVAAEIEANDGEGLNKMLPELTELALAPYLDNAEASRIAQSIT
jgi:AcrR family transcriptional regulator